MKKLQSLCKQKHSQRKYAMNIFVRCLCCTHLIDDDNSKNTKYIELVSKVPPKVLRTQAFVAKTEVPFDCTQSQNLVAPTYMVSIQ